MSYFLSPALVQLRTEVNTRWPRRSKASDGWIGDTSHAARPSDHNPDWTDGGIVRAIDVTASGIDVNALLDAVLKDVRTRYVIWNRRIWTRDTARWAAYSGPNPHTKHVHISVRSIGNHDRSTAAWGVVKVDRGDAASRGDDRGLALNGKLDAATIKAWQKAEGTKVDGRISKPYSALLAAVETSINARNAEHRFLAGKPLKVDGKFGVRDRIAFVKYLNELHRRRPFLAGGKLSTVRDLISGRRNNALKKALNLGLIK